VVAVRRDGGESYSPFGAVVGVRLGPTPPYLSASVPMRCPSLSGVGCRSCCQNGCQGHCLTRWDPTRPSKVSTTVRRCASDPENSDNSESCHLPLSNVVRRCWVNCGVKDLRFGAYFL